VLARSGGHRVPTYSIHFNYIKILRLKYIILQAYTNSGHGTVAYPGILFGGGVQQIQLKTEGRENGDVGAEAHYHGFRSIFNPV
jgi:hypothetical protein